MLGDLLVPRTISSITDIDYGVPQAGGASPLITGLLLTFFHGYMTARRLRCKRGFGETLQCLHIMKESRIRVSLRSHGLCRYA